MQEQTGSSHLHIGRKRLFGAFPLADVRYHGTVPTAPLYNFGPQLQQLHIIQRFIQVEPQPVTCRDQLRIAPVDLVLPRGPRSAERDQHERAMLAEGRHLTGMETDARYYL